MTYVIIFLRHLKAQLTLLALIYLLNVSWDILYPTVDVNFRITK